MKTVVFITFVFDVFILRFTLSSNVTNTLEVKSPNRNQSSRRDDPSYLEGIVERLSLEVAAIGRNVKELNYLQLRMTRQIVEDIKKSCTGFQDNSFITSGNSSILKMKDIEHISSSSAERDDTLIKDHAIRCSNYRALHEFIPVKDVSSNNELLEVGWDAIHGPLYFCHALVKINGIECRLYGKGNRRTCWVSTPGGREHRVTERYHLLRIPEAVNLEWRREWPIDAAKFPLPELKTAGGIPYEWAVWDIYTCGLAPRFYFGRCDRKGAKIPGLIHFGERKRLIFTYAGREEHCENYEILVCINK